ncbi:MAG TPA: DNA mismatch repair endonuclease MutL [Bacteroidia bacterium]|nr:DNA mismatch repair endonuclease MutL [Bacteroidia bacterium]
MDIIKLLPDAVANQIAAGEVIQRPASAVKELLENAIDAGADTIKLIIKDAGKTLIQVIDNGSGMSDTDARMSFERHATSKLQNADDLFNIRTKGFRGEALASIAAIAQVTLSTRRYDDEIGTEIVIEGSDVKSQQAVATPAGTTFSVRQLFFNTPARRNFLKSNAQEMRHVLEEFMRVAIPHFNIAFSLFHDNTEVFQVKAANLRQRICNLLGANYNERLVPVEEETSIVKIFGFIGKPEHAKKVRGEQYFFINNRFVRDGFLNHAVNNGYEGLIPKDAHPSYFIFIEVNPASIDVNIHPTKTQIKFEVERSVYAIIRSAVKRALGKFSVAPSLDFEHSTTFDLPLSQLQQQPKQPQISINPDYNPFKTTTDFNPRHNVESSTHKINFEQWQALQQQIETGAQQINSSSQNALYTNQNCFQVLNKYIVFVHTMGLVMVNQQAAHERVLFENNKAAFQNKTNSSQQSLFPQTMQLTAENFVIMQELESDLKQLGFDLNVFGKDTYLVHGIPTWATKGSEVTLLESILEQFKMNSKSFRLELRNNLAKSMARAASIKVGTALSDAEMKSLLTDLFQSNLPNDGIYGGKIFTLLQADELDKLV